LYEDVTTTLRGVRDPRPGHCIRVHDHRGDLVLTTRPEPVSTPKLAEPAPVSAYRSRLSQANTVNRRLAGRGARPRLAVSASIMPILRITGRTCLRPTSWPSQLQAAQGSSRGCSEAEELIKLLRSGRSRRTGTGQQAPFTDASRVCVLSVRNREDAGRPTANRKRPFDKNSQFS